jgi:hypothetical protein
MCYDTFVGYGVVYSKNELESFLHRKFGEFSHISEVREHFHFPYEFEIIEVKDLYILGKRYSSMDFEVTRDGFEQEVRVCIEDFLHGSGLYESPGRLSFVFDLVMEGACS